MPQELRKIDASDFGASQPPASWQKLPAGWRLLVISSDFITSSDFRTVAAVFPNFGLRVFGRSAAPEYASGQYPILAGDAYNVFHSL